MTRQYVKVVKRAALARKVKLWLTKDGYRFKIRNYDGHIWQWVDSSVYVTKHLAWRGFAEKWGDRFITKGE